MAEKLIEDERDMSASEMVDTTTSVKQDDATESTEVLEYVQKLIARMNANAPVSSSSRSDAPPPSTSKAGSSDGKRADAAINEKPSPPKPPQPRRTPRPRPKTTDCRDSLMRLREVANLTTQSALQSFSHRNLIRNAYRWFYFALGFIALSAILICMVQAETSLTKWICRGCVAVSIGSTIGYCLTVRKISRQYSV